MPVQEYPREDNSNPTFTNLTVNTVPKADADGNLVNSRITDDGNVVQINNGLATFSGDNDGNIVLGNPGAKSIRISGANGDNVILITGLPTSDPGFQGALYTVAGVLMVSA